MYLIYMTVLKKKGKFSVTRKAFLVNSLTLFFIMFHSINSVNNDRLTCPNRIYLLVTALHSKLVPFH